jgi:hypothetical protein
MNQQTLTDALKFIFSWIILLAIGVIVSGKLLAQKFKFEAGTGQLFRIPIKGILTIEATGAEVVLGFTFYLICVLLLGITFGAGLQPWVKVHFGIDPGQFNALGFLSSLAAVAISAAIFLLSKIPPPAADTKAVRRRNKIVEQITAEKLSNDPTDDLKPPRGTDV